MLTRYIIFYQKLEYFNKVPDYNSYLAYILTQMPQEDQYVRSVAGLTLKNNIRAHYATIPPQVLEYVKQCCLQNIGDPNIGKAVGFVIAAIVEQGQVHNWLQALQVLMEKLDDPNLVVVEVCSESIAYDEDPLNSWSCRTPLLPYKKSAKIVHGTWMAMLVVYNLFSL